MPANGCDIILPIADYAVGNGTGAQYHIAAFGLFHILKGSGNQKVVGWLDDTAEFSNGLTTLGQCQPNNAFCVIKLADFPTNGLNE